MFKMLTGYVFSVIFSYSYFYLLFECGIHAFFKFFQCNLIPKQNKNINTMPQVNTFRKYCNFHRRMETIWVKTNSFHKIQHKLLKTVCQSRKAFSRLAFIFIIFLSKDVNQLYTRFPPPPSTDKNVSFESCVVFPWRLAPGAVHKKHLLKIEAREAKDRLFIKKNHQPRWCLNKSSASKGHCLHSTANL